jgi:hypothetical protein
MRPTESRTSRAGWVSTTATGRSLTRSPDGSRSARGSAVENRQQATGERERPQRWGDLAGAEPPRRCHGGRRPTGRRRASSVADPWQPRCRRFPTGPADGDLPPIETYKIAVEEHRFQAQFNWSRTQYLLALNALVLVVAPRRRRTSRSRRLGGSTPRRPSVMWPHDQRYPGRASDPAAGTVADLVGAVVLAR